MDKNELKVQALTERLAQVTAEQENRIADLRVELTIVSLERDEYKKKVEEFESPKEDAKASDK